MAPASKAETALQPGTKTSTQSAKEKNLEWIVKESSNPLGNLWMLWFQNDYTWYHGDDVPGHKQGNSLKFQPVMAFPFEVAGETWKFISRPILQYQSVPFRESAGRLLGKSKREIASDPTLAGIAERPRGHTSGLGDTVLLTIAGPAHHDGFIWGVGPTQIFPTAEKVMLGQGKWQAGPAN